MVPENEKVRKGQKGSQGAKRVTRDRETETQSEVGHPKIVRDNTLPFMTFYDVLCPLVPENEKVRKGKKGHKGQRDRETQTQKQNG